jgi:hypothetical protein
MILYGVWSYCSNFFNMHTRVQEHYSWLEICLQVHFYYYIEASFPLDPMRSIRVQPHDTSSRLYGSSWIVGVRMSLGMNVNTTTLIKIHRHCDKRKHKDDTALINTICPIIWFLQSCRPDQFKNCIERWSYKCWIDPRTVINSATIIYTADKESSLENLSVAYQIETFCQIGSFQHLISEHKFSPQAT